MIFSGAASRAILDGLPYLILTVLGVVATGLTAGYYLWAVRRIFYGQVPEDLETVSDPPRTILAIGAVLAILVVVLGVYPWLLWRWVSPVLSGFILGG